MSLLQAILIASIALATITVAEHNVCRENEKSDLCGRMCEPTCENPKPNPRFCPRIQCTKFTRASRCDDGYLRDSSGCCRLPEDCTKE